MTRRDDHEPGTGDPRTGDPGSAAAKTSQEASDPFAGIHGNLADLTQGQQQAVFVGWLGAQRGREDDAGKVARFVLETNPAGWPHTVMNTYRGARDDAVLDQYLWYLRWVHDDSEEAAEIFRRVWAEFERDVSRRKAG